MSPSWVGGRPPAHVVIEAHIVDRVEYDITEDGRTTVRGVRGAGPRIIEELANAGYAVVHPTNIAHRKAVRDMMRQESEHAERYARAQERQDDQGPTTGAIPRTEAE